MCTTCDFTFPGDVHLCPVCAAAPRGNLSQRRKKLVIFSFVLAIWATAGMTCLLCGVFAGMARTKADQSLLGIVLMLFVLAPAVAGLTLAVTAKERRLSNPPSIWIATAWNGILVGCFILLTIYGLFKE